MKVFAALFGIVFILLGIAGFVHRLVFNDLLIRVFRINVLLNCLHLASGIWALGVSFEKRAVIVLYFQIIGVLYALLAVLGFIYQNEDILGIFATNSSTNWLHVIIATSALILGYGSDE